VLSTRLSSEQRAFYVAVCSGKGGVGKSTVSLLLAGRFAEQGHRTLLIDADLGIGDVATLTNARITHGFEQLLTGRTSLKDAVVKVGARLWLLGTMPGSYLPVGELSPLGLKECSEMDTIFDVVVIDTPSTLDPLYLGIIAASDLAVTVTGQGIASVADSYVQLKKIVEHGGKARHGFIVNRVDRESDGEQVKVKFKELVERFLRIETDPLLLLPNSPAILRATENQSLLTVAREPHDIGRLVAGLVNSLEMNYLSINRSVSSLWNRLERLELLRSAPAFDDTEMVAFNRSNSVTAGQLLTK
jgi:flagellar biosynthesis protein FlhG